MYRYASPESELALGKLAVWALAPVFCDGTEASAKTANPNIKIDDALVVKQRLAPPVDPPVVFALHSVPPGAAFLLFALKFS